MLWPRSCRPARRSLQEAALDVEFGTQVAEQIGQGLEREVVAPLSLTPSPGRPPTWRRRRAGSDVTSAAPFERSTVG